ncbi:MAG: CpsD/CapB family tyrosine-protein kinase [Acidimicrobiales bacterium]
MPRLSRRGEPPTARAVAADEAFRVLRTNVLVALSDLANPVVVITSAQAGEGKTTACTGLAASLASIGQRIVAVDFDLRQPSLHRGFGAHNEFGVTNFLLDRKPLAECLQYVSLSDGDEEGQGLYLLATGPSVNNPTELLTAERTKRLLDALSAQADVVLIDSPPVLPIADTLEIGRMAAGAILVVEARHTEVGTAQRAKDALIQNRTRLLGVIMNKVPAEEVGYGYGSSVPQLGSGG